MKGMHFLTPTNFNSRPSARGDQIHFCRRCDCKSFQFTPLREGRLIVTNMNNKIEKFQFTPLREGRLVNISV